MAGREDVGAADHADAGASFLRAEPVRSKPRPVGRIHARRRAAARIFFAGDTAYAPFFRDIRQRLGPIDLALLPIGAYEPRWFMQAVHMNPAEAVQAHLDLEASESVGMHFGTFQLTTEGIDEPLRALEQARRAQACGAVAFQGDWLRRIGPGRLEPMECHDR